ncbi:MAG TPA: hypothetical protein PKN81_15680, partial [Anaerolineales bacterium]|nr:hypothetical protein [Anaerolineales bacterium]
LQAASTQLELIQARLGSEHTKLLADQNALVAELEQLIEEREATLSPLDTSLLQIYEDLRQQKRGIAVTEITDNSCAACGGTLNSAIQQSARSQKLANCPTCGRILYSN